MHPSQAALSTSLASATPPASAVAAVSAASPLTAALQTLVRQLVARKQLSPQQDAQGIVYEVRSNDKVGDGGGDAAAACIHSCHLQLVIATVVAASHPRTWQLSLSWCLTGTASGVDICPSLQSGVGREQSYSRS